MAEIAPLLPAELLRRADHLVAEPGRWGSDFTLESGRALGRRK